MKKFILELIEKKKKKITYVYDAEGNDVLLRNLEEGKDYFFNKVQTTNEKTRQSFKDAIGYKKIVAPKVIEEVVKETKKVIKKSVKKSYKKASK